MFCHLEKDNKTYHYIKLFIKTLQKTHDFKEVAELDKDIQSGEIYDHLRNNGFSEKDSKEMINWVEHYAKDFRDYLNTLKLAAVFWYWNHKSSSEEEFNWNDFCELDDEVNDSKFCLDTIF